MSPNTACCIQRGPNLTASRTPFQFLTGCGGFQRRSPTGGAANGTPRKARTPSTVVPATVPFEVLTCTGLLPPAASALPVSIVASPAAMANRDARHVAFIVSSPPVNVVSIARAPLREGRPQSVAMRAERRTARSAWNSYDNGSNECKWLLTRCQRFRSRRRIRRTISRVFDG